MTNYVDVFIDAVLKETDAALLVGIDDRELWIPKSVLESHDDLDEDTGETTIYVAEWFANKEGLI